MEIITLVHLGILLSSIPVLVTSRVTKPVTVPEAFFQLMAGYARQERPKQGGNAVDVMLSVDIANMNYDRTNNEVSVDMFVGQEWQDPRLVLSLPGFEKFNMGGSYVDQIWSPDTFMPNMVGGDSIRRKPLTESGLLLKAKGWIFYSYRLQGRFRCNPPRSNPSTTGTRQTNIVCPIHFESYSYPTSEMTYWEHKMTYSNPTPRDFISMTVQTSTSTRATLPMPGSFTRMSVELRF